MATAATTSTDRPKALGARTLCEALIATAGERGGQTALRTPQDTPSLTYAEAMERIEALAAGLYGLGVRRGDAVGLMLTNRPGFHLFDAAAMMLGASLHEALDPRERRLGLAQGVLAVLDHRAVVRGAEVVAQHDRPPLLDHLGDEDRVAQRLGHLVAGHGDPGVVHPVLREVVAEGLGLGDLVLVVREDQVEAAAVDVEGGAQVLVGHRRALQVPAGAARAPWRRPGRLTGLGGLPHGEVARVPLAG